MNEPIEICWFHYLGTCSHGSNCIWNHVSKKQIDSNVQYVFCSGTNHRRTVEQTRRQIESDRVQEKIKPFREYVAYTPAPPSPKREEKHISAIRFKTVETKDDGVFVTMWESQMTFEEIEKKYGAVYDAEYTVAFAKRNDEMIERAELKKRKPRTNWADM